MFQLLIILTCLCEGRGQLIDDSWVMKHLPSVMQEFCPGISVCSTNRSATAAENSCCAECSCEADCTFNGDCCFPKRRRSNPDTIKRSQEPQNEKLCLSPMLPLPKKIDRARFQPFSMVSFIDKPIVSSSNRLSNSSCGERNVAPWGSMHPVYSATSKQIYKNKECAEADGIVDGVLWDVEFICDSEDVYAATMRLELLMFPESCFINFRYPGNTDDIKSLKCYISLIATCPESLDFLIPEGTNLSKSEIVSLCTSGLLSPYEANKMYANVFCHICNGEYYSQHLTCEKSDDGMRVITAKGFVALFDGEIIAEKNENRDDQKAAVPLACSLQDTSKCRHVFCPSGQLRNKRGKCIYPSKLWYNQHYVVYINLTSEKSINMTDLFKVPSGERTFLLPQLESPWKQGWSVHNIFYEETGIDHISNNFIFRIGIKLPRMKPSSIVQYINNTVKREWYVDLNNETVVLKSPNFSKFAKVSLHADSIRMPLSEKLAVEHVKQRYSLIYTTLFNVRSLELAITKLYVCEQVELNQSEFILSQDESTLYSYTTQRFLFDGEFVIIKNNINEGFRARICIEDSGLHKIGRVTMRNIGNIQGLVNLYGLSLGLLSEVMYIRYQMYILFY